jgi:hypothetical protein
LPWITAALAIAMLGRAPDKPPQEKTIGVHYWLEADDTFLRPGEGTEIYLWVDYDPDAGSPVTYEHPRDA